jgi:hypothetical protein
VNGELLPVTELCKSDWLEKFMQKVDDVPLAIANECSPPVTPLPCHKMMIPGYMLHVRKTKNLVNVKSLNITDCILF